jgi:hypothetical protein
MDVDDLGLLSAEFVQDCKTRKRKMTNNIDEIIFLNGIQQFLLCALAYRHTPRNVYSTRVDPKISFENTYAATRLFAFCCKKSLDLIVLLPHYPFA